MADPGGDDRPPGTRKRADLREHLEELGLAGLSREAWFHLRRSGEYASALLGHRPAPHDALLLVGSGRGGTTWIADMLCAGSRVQQIFEPLHPTAFPEVCDLTGWREEHHPHIRSWYLPADSDDPRWRDFLGRVLAGRVRNPWTDVVRTSFVPRRFLIKMIRANLLLGFLHEAFQCRIGLVVRHPCAAVASRIQCGWHADVEDILGQERLVEDHLRPWIPQIERERDALGAHAVWWAVESLVAVRSLADRPHHAVFYEDVVRDPGAALAPLRRWFGIPATDAARASESLDSRTAARAEGSAADRLGGWRGALSESDRERVLSWARRLGIDWYDEGDVPLCGSPSEGGG